MKEKKHSFDHRIIMDLVITVILVLIDRVIKIYAVSRLKEHPSISLIKGILELTYLENTGAAFGLLKGQKYFFILVGVIILLSIIYLIFKMPRKKKYNAAHVALSLIAAGAIGNMTDRIIYDYVMDYIYFSVIRFPIFNVADIYVTVATVMMLILLLFVYKEDDLNVLRIKEKRLREID